MKNLRMLGGNFSHAKSSTLYKESENIQYAQDANESISIDHFEPATYAWVCESRAICPLPYEQAVSNYETYKKTYKYIFTHDYSLIEKDSDLFKYVPADWCWVDTPTLPNKSKILSFITSNKTMCPGHIYRLSWKEKLEPFCDLYGRGFNEIERKEDGLSDYMFSVAIENAKYDAYFTEKILDCFAMGCVPIYYGTEKVCDFFNSDGIIFLSDDFDPRSLNKELYLSKEKAIQENLEIVKSIRTSEDYMFKTYFNN
tara:strand:- start:770 stop:1537 length:768 start_codon:yes stop_codon:yes gene_type:complete